MKQPDRYSLLALAWDELPERIAQANALGMKWFARADYGGRRDVLFYIFFDEEGLQAYLTKTWGNKLDLVGEWVAQLKNKEIDAAVFEQRCIELFDDNI